MFKNILELQKNAEAAWAAYDDLLTSEFRKLGCYRYKEVYDDRAYHAKGLDVPAKVDTNSRSEKKAMHGTWEASKIWEGGSVNFQYLISPKNSCTYYR